jgi:N-acetyl sugar amidotransferase
MCQVFINSRICWLQKKMKGSANMAQNIECSRCLLTLDDDRDITFDARNVCSHCLAFDQSWENVPKTVDESFALVDKSIEKMKRENIGQTYDCLLGVSGGVDSTFLALRLVQLGVKPLLIHFDNGWNSELAVMNIQNIVDTLGLDLITYVIDWDDFRELQLAYLKASVIDIEVLTDHAIYGAMYQVAIDQQITTIVSGVNVATEQVLPQGWIYDKLDDINIRSIYSAFGSGRKLTRYPFVDNSMRRKIRRSRIEIVRLLDQMIYDVEDAKGQIVQKLNWRAYEGKHFESIFTRFYQGHILPTKFGVDKRKAHLSNLICSGQLSKEEAIDQFGIENYPAELKAQDMVFVLKKLGLTQSEFDILMESPPRRHRDFDQRGSFFAHYPVFKPLRPIWTKIKKSVEG